MVVSTCSAIASLQSTSLSSLRPLIRQVPLLMTLRRPCQSSRPIWKSEVAYTTWNLWDYSKASSRKKARKTWITYARPWKARNNGVSRPCKADCSIIWSPVRHQETLRVTSQRQLKLNAVAIMRLIHMTTLQRPVMNAMKLGSHLHHPLEEQIGSLKWRTRNLRLSRKKQMQRLERLSSRLDSWSLLSKSFWPCLQSWYSSVWGIRFYGFFSGFYLEPTPLYLSHTLTTCQAFRLTPQKRP